MTQTVAAYLQGMNIWLPGAGGYVPAQVVRLLNGLSHLSKAVLVDVDPGEDLRKAADDGGQYRWITVHPHGDQENGVPVKIRVNPDGSGSVVAGAGGKLNMMKLTHLKSPEEYRSIARQRRKEKREREKYMDKDDKAAKNAALEAINAKEVAARAAYLRTVSQAQGWGDWKLPQEVAENAPGSVVDRLERARMRDILRKADQVVDNIRERVIEEHDATVAHHLGEVSVADLDTTAESDNTGMGYVAAVERVARESGLEKPTEGKLATETRHKSFQEAEDNGYIESAAKAEEATKALMAGAAGAREEDRPYREEGLHKVEAETALQDPTAAKDILLAHQAYKAEMKELDRLRRQVTGASPDLTAEVARGVTMAVGERKTSAKELQQLEQDLENDLRAAALQKSNSALLSEIEKLQDDPAAPLAHHVNTGRYDSLNEIAGTVFRQSCPIDRLTADLLGTDAAAHLMAHALASNLSPEDLQVVRDALGDYHVETQRQVADDAVRQAADKIKEANAATEGIKLEAATADDLVLAQQANAQRRRLLNEAAQSLGEAHGRLEMAGTLNFALLGRPANELRCALGQISTRRAFQIAESLGIGKGQCEVVSDGPNKVLVIPRDAWDTLIHPVDKDRAAAYDRAVAIKRGDNDEVGWLPQGFRDPSALPQFEEAEAATAFARPLSLRPDMTPAEVHQEAFDFIDRALADNPYNPRGVRDEITCAEFTGSYVPLSCQDAYGKAIADYFPEKDLDEAGTAEMFKQRVEAAREKMLGAGEIGSGDQTLHSQAIELGESTYDAMHSALAKVPEAAVVFRPVKTPEDRRAVQAAVQDYFWKNLTKEKREDAAAARAQAREGAQKAARTVTVTNMFGEEEEVPAVEGGAAAAPKAEPDAWQRFIASFGSGPKATQRAYEALQDHMKGQFAEAFAKEYEKRFGVQLKTGTRQVPHWDRFVIGSASKEVRQSLLDEEASKRASAGARAAARVGGRFAPGERREMADRILRRAQEAHQMGFFSQGSHRPVSDRTTLGDTVEEQISKIIPTVAANFRPGKKVELPTEVRMDGRYVRQQRAIRLVEANKRIGLHLGVGSGKTNVGMGSFVDLQKQGKVSRGIFAVPSVVAQQFGSEALKYLEPRSPDGKKGYRWAAVSGLDRAGRLAKYKDPNTHMVFVTHQALREDIIHELAKANHGGDEAAAAEWLRTTPEGERRPVVQKCLRDAGWSFDYSMVDEGHDLLNRKGKANSAMANAIDDYTSGHEYHISATGTPVKNDVSEAFDLLHKLRPDLYPQSSQAEFLRRYGLNTQAAAEALQREMAAHVYADKIDSGATRITHEHTVDLSPRQREVYRQVLQAYRDARRLPAGSPESIAAMKILAPQRFATTPESEHAALAKDLSSGKGMLRDMMLHRVEHAHDDIPDEHNALLQELLHVADGYRTAAADGGMKPGIVFAHHYASVDALTRALKGAGYRVGKMTGKQTTTDKEVARIGFHPPGQYDGMAPAEKAAARRRDAKYDVLVASDAAACGANLQRAGWLANYDNSDTSKTTEQRIGRMDRIGQEEDTVYVHNLTANTPTDKRRRQRVTDKHELGEVFQSPTELLDDTGLAHHIRLRRELAIGNAASATNPAVQNATA